MRGPQQQPEGEEVHPEKRWYVKNGDRIAGPELPRHRRQVEPGREHGVSDEVGEADQIECPHQWPEDEGHAHGQQRENREYSGGQVTVSRRHGKARRQVRPDKPGQQEDQTEETKTI